MGIFLWDVHILLHDVASYFSKDGKMRDLKNKINKFFLLFLRRHSYSSRFVPTECRSGTVLVLCPPRLASAIWECHPYFCAWHLLWDVSDIGICHLRLPSPSMGLASFIWECSPHHWYASCAWGRYLYFWARHLLSEMGNCQVGVQSL